MRKIDCSLKASTAIVCLALFGAAGTQARAESPDCGADIECIYGEYHVEEERLNRVYNELKRRLSKEQREGLLAAQRLWIQFREKECKWQKIGSEGGTDERRIEISCLAELAKQRSDQLERL